MHSDEVISGLSTHRSIRDDISRYKVYSFSLGRYFTPVYRLIAQFPVILNEGVASKVAVIVMIFWCYRYGVYHLHDGI